MILPHAIKYFKCAYFLLLSRENKLTNSVCLLTYTAVMLGFMECGCLVSIRGCLASLVDPNELGKKYYVRSDNKPFSFLIRTVVV